jgi:hypothetical protein
MKPNNETPSVILLILALIVIFFVTLNGKSIKEDIKTNKYQTICFVHKYGKGGGRGKSLIHFYYYFNKLRYESNEIVEYPKLYFNKYYEIELSSKKPENVEIFLNKEIKDLVKIKEAGF